jgi:threonylcarbamoyladenosine tRNA methylthiotransferase MtaB
MPQVPKNIRKERAAILRAEGIKELHKFFNQNIGRDVNILVEKNNMAHTENFIPVKIDGNYNVGEVIKAKLHSFSSNYMIARAS